MNFDLRLRSDLHFSRKMTHLTGILFMWALYQILSPHLSRLLLYIGGSTLIFLDFLRQRNPKLNQIAIRIAGPVMRRHEAESFSGLTFVLLGTAFTVTLFPPHIVSLTLLLQAFGDPVASYFGILYGKEKLINHKTLQGTTAAFIVCILISLFYYYANNIMTERLLIVGVLSGMIGAIAELIPIGKLDDNLTFPVLCSTLLWLLFQLFGGITL